MDRATMKLSLMIGICGVLLLFAPGSAQAQVPTCGDADYLNVQCSYGCTGSMRVYWPIGCDDEPQGQYWSPYTVQCGTGADCTQRVQNYFPAGSCDCPGTARALISRSASVNAAGMAYVDAYVRVCDGRYLAVRLPI